MFPTVRKVRYYNIPGHAHEIALSCAHDITPFQNEAVCRIVCEEIRRARQMHDFRLLAYVILPRELCMVIWPQRSRYDIAAIVREIKGITAARYEHFSKDNGIAHEQPLWMQRDCRHANLRSTQAIADAIQWTETAPVRAGLAEAADRWKWSSAYARKHGRGLQPDGFRLCGAYMQTPFRMEANQTLPLRSFRN